MIEIKDDVEKVLKKLKLFDNAKEQTSDIPNNLYSFENLRDTVASAETKTDKKAVGLLSHS